MSGPGPPRGGIMTQHGELDLAVIGTGGAAMSAAIHARLEGASVVAIESGTLGGTCVNVGCVPSKTLLAATHTRHAALTNPFPGVPRQVVGRDSSISKLGMVGSARPMCTSIGRFQAIAS
ncbi:FAD-dependent oxidoreductase [Microbacterium sp. HA-8]|uniref:FAD-dependent oxidoreductase n=1 Tax=Microbacterium sp. HA-8 TaxID=3234200 RepID=UPI0038F6E95C